MNKELWIKKIIQLRKKHHYTQQEVADKLNVSNKTISRWETGESYPDIEMLQNLALLYHVTTDYLLNDHENFIDIHKTDITRFIPWAIGILAVLIYYICILIKVPGVLSFALFYFMINFSYYFFRKYTDKRNNKEFVIMNTITSFFAFQAFVSKVIILLYYVNMLLSMEDFMNGYLPEMNVSLSGLIYSVIIGYVCAGIYAYYHYKRHIDVVKK